MTDKLHPAVLRAAAIIETHQFVQKETAIIFDRETHYTELVKALKKVMEGTEWLKAKEFEKFRALLDRIEKGT